MLANRSALTLIVIPFVASTLYGQALFDKPVTVLGDPNFIGTAAKPLAFDSPGPNWVEGREVNQPGGIALDTSVSPPILYIADTGNNRVLAFQYATQLTPGSYADLILGQPNQYTTVREGPGTSFSTGLNAPTGLVVDSMGNLYVADSGDNRILRYPKPFSQPAGYQFPDLIIGQTSFTGSGANTGGIKASTLFLSGSNFFPHTGLAFDSAGNLWVTDTGNNRVLRFPVSVLVPNQNGPSADTVIGQSTFISSTPATTQTTLTALVNPTSVSFDSAGNMLVADAGLRVVVYGPGISSGAAAMRVLGVPLLNAPEPTATGVGFVTSVVAAGSNVIVVDNTNNRILSYSAVSAWPPVTTQTSPTAGIVVGQPDFTSSKSNQGGPATNATFNSPVDIAASGSELFVTDSGNNRILVFPLNANGPSGAASRVIGQLDFPYTAPNLVVGLEFYTSRGLNNVGGSAILDLNSTPPHLYVADTFNNRVLGFNNFTTAVNGQKADIVIGQPDLLHTTVNYPSNVATTPNNQGLFAPTALAVDSTGNLYVADDGNDRIVRFPAPFAAGAPTALETADLVIGQENFSSAITDTTAVTLNTPVALAFTQPPANPNNTTSPSLVVADAAQNRVLVFQPPFSNGMSASLVLGQPDFTSSGSSTATTGFSAPTGVAVDPENRIIVSDTGNSRVAVFETLANLTNDPAPSFVLTSGLSAPESIAMEQNGEFWVADPGRNQLDHFVSVDNLPIANYSSDASQPAIEPRSVFADPYNNLLVADGINRILYFAPGLAVVNAANYLTGRALAPGTYAAIFPAVSTNVLASGTGSATSFPLPTVLAGTQVMINGAAVPLEFVSTGQINFPLSLSLPTGGTVDVEVVAQATGQIYGGGEIALSSASPALFTSGGTGTGQVAALNQDNSINSPTNPLTRGQVIQLFGTGQGPVANAPPDGEPATVATSTAVNPQILLNGAYVPPANVQYSGLAPDLIGVWQINFTVPTTVTAGSDVPLVVIMNSIPSDNPASPGQIATTIALK